MLNGFKVFKGKGVHNKLIISMKKQVNKQINKIGNISGERPGSQSSNLGAERFFDLMKAKTGAVAQPALTANNLDYLRTTLRTVF